MIALFQNDIHGNNRQSSKGNQLKWRKEENWYKADFTGYEGFSEYMVSGLLQYSTLAPEEYVTYQIEEISYGGTLWKGCRSRNFLPEGWQLITLERLFQKQFGESLYKSMYRITEHKQRLRFLVEQIERITGLPDFGIYMSKLLAVDTFFLNEDRHTHNIAVLMDNEEKYHLCPIFDCGQALLSDITMDYPLEADLDLLLDQVKAKTFCSDFFEQLDIAESLYGNQIRFDFDETKIDALIKKETSYSPEIKKRVKEIVMIQKRKYQYLFR